MNVEIEYFNKHIEECLYFTKNIFQDWKYLVKTESWQEGVIDFFYQRLENGDFN